MATQERERPTESAFRGRELERVETLLKKHRALGRTLRIGHYDKSRSDHCKYRQRAAAHCGNFPKVQKKKKKRGDGRKERGESQL
jgi:hypothetical protein